MVVKKVGNGVQAPIVTEWLKCSGYCLNVSNGVTERSGQNAAATDGTWHATDSCQWQWRGPLPSPPHSSMRCSILGDP